MVYDFYDNPARFNHHTEFKHGINKHLKAQDMVEKKKSGTREITVVRKVLNVNDKMAEQNRRLFADNDLFVLNIMSSPGSGKTTILEKTLNLLMPQIRCSVIVGDICTTQDADRLALSDAPVVQINTDQFGGDCHLTAHVVEKAALSLDLAKIDLLIIENVGNLVCPAEFDVGEDAKIVILSVTEGEDKPLKYPLMFRECELALLNKIDLLPYLDYDKELAINNIGQINSGMPIFEISARQETGFDPWIQWIKDKVAKKNG